MAYFETASGLGMLGPRGWHCFSLYGSDGEQLFVSPVAISFELLQTLGWKGFEGPMLELALSNGDTSGRFQVARVAARAFPDRRRFVQDVVAEGIAPASDFASGPYPTDTMRSKGKDTVEYETPAGREGMGTMSRVARGNGPIRGVAVLMGKAPDLEYLAMRLPAGLETLAPAILQELELGSAAAQ